MNTHTYVVNSKEFLIPQEWKALLGDDVLSYQTTLSSYLISVHINPQTFIRYCAQLDDFNSWYDVKKQRALSQHLRNKKRKIILDGNVFILPDDWRSLLGEDVIFGKKRLSVRLQELKIDRANFIKRMKASEDFYSWWKKSNQSLLKNRENSLNEIREKALGTTKERFPDGVMRDKEVLHKYEETSLKRYGTTHPFRSEKIKRKIKESLLNSYGVTTPLQSDEIKKKFKATNFARYNKATSAAMTQEECERRLKLWNLTRLSEYKGILSPILVKCNSCGLEFETTFISGHQGGSQLHVCPFCNKNTTSFESAIAAHLIDKGFKVIRHFRPTFLDRKEIDIYLKDLNIGIEINGALSHNSSVGYKGSQPKSYNYHALKSRLCAEHGIELFHLWEHWGREAAIYLLDAKLGIFDSKIGARKLIVNENPDNRKVRLFLNANHVLGYSPASLTLTLENSEGRIFQVIQFRKATDKVVTLSRNATLRGYSIVGGFKRLMSHAINHLSEYEQIETFAIRDITPNPQNSCYARYGFELEGDSGPTMFYWISNSVLLPDGTRLPAGFKARNQLMKSKLLLKGVVFGNKTEAEKLKELGIYRVYNSGCWKFTYNLSSQARKDIDTEI